MGIELHFERSNGAAVIYCSGEVKARAEAHHFRATVADWFKRCRHVTVDLGRR